MVGGRGVRVTKAALLVLVAFMASVTCTDQTLPKFGKLFNF
jgi:hypothetical protein